MSLKEKLRQLKGRRMEPVVDWEAEKERWLSSVGHLFEEVRGWLSDLADEGLLKITENEIFTHEESIGTYPVPTLEIDFAGKCAILEPIGANITGCDGRLDFFLRGESFRGYMLLLVRDEDEKDHWQMVGRVVSEKPRLFSKEIMESKLEKWLDF